MQLEWVWVTSAVSEVRAPFPVAGQRKDNLNRMGAQAWELIFIDKPNYIFNVTGATRGCRSNKLKPMVEGLWPVQYQGLPGNGGGVAVFVNGDFLARRHRLQL
jgi:hypothetical protein